MMRAMTRIMTFMMITSNTFTCTNTQRDTHLSYGLCWAHSLLDGCSSLVIQSRARFGEGTLLSIAADIRSVQFRWEPWSRARWWACSLLADLSWYVKRVRACRWNICKLDARTKTHIIVIVWWLYDDNVECVGIKRFKLKKNTSEWPSGHLATLSGSFWTGFGLVWNLFWVKSFLHTYTLEIIVNVEH